MGPKHWQKHHTVFILPSTLELRAMKLPVPTPHFVAYTGHYHWTSGDNQLISASAPVLSPSFSIGPITTSFDLSPPAALTFLPVLHLRAYHRILHINPRHHLHPKKKKKKTVAKVDVWPCEWPPWKKAKPRAEAYDNIIRLTSLKLGESKKELNRSRDELEILNEDRRGERRRRELARAKERVEVGPVQAEGGTEAQQSATKSPLSRENGRNRGASKRS